MILVDDHAAVLRQVIQVLGFEFDIVDALENGSGLQEAVEKHRPDVVVLDITLPGASGIALASRLTRAGCSAKIVFLTVHSDPDYVQAAFAAGAAGYVVKMRLSQDLVPALHAVLEGKRFISPCMELPE